MSIYKVYGLSEMMIQHCDIDKNTFSQMERREYSDFIDEYIVSTNNTKGNPQEKVVKTTLIKMKDNKAK